MRQNCFPPPSKKASPGRNPWETVKHGQLMKIFFGDGWAPHWFLAWRSRCGREQALEKEPSPHWFLAPHGGEVRGGKKECRLGYWAHPTLILRTVQMWSPGGWESAGGRGQGGCLGFIRHKANGNIFHDIFLTFQQIFSGIYKPNKALCWCTWTRKWNWLLYKQ